MRSSVLVCLAISHSFAAQPQPTLQLPVTRLADFGAESAGDISPIFIGENEIALQVRPISGQTSPSGVWLLQLVDGRVTNRLLPVATAAVRDFRALSGRRLATVGLGKLTVFSSDGHRLYEVKAKSIVPGPQGGDVAGEWTSSGWKVHRLGITPQLLRSGDGELQSLSSRCVVYRRGDDIRTESLDGVVLGEFRMPANTRHQRIVELAGDDRLYVSDYGHERIVDFSGRQKLQIAAPPGWGFRHAWSGNGKRMVFDHFTRSVSVATRLLETLATPIAPLPEHANGEVIRVLDTTSGAVCLNLEKVDGLFGFEGILHAAISPSGRMLVIAARSEISLYALPEHCP